MVRVQFMLGWCALASLTLAPGLCLNGVPAHPRGFLDAVQTITYFNYVHCVMDALGIEPEAEMRYRRTDPS